MVRRLVGELLELEGFDVDSFASAAPALEFLATAGSMASDDGSARRTAPGLAILDWLLPDASGEALLTEVLARSCGTQCIVISGQRLQLTGDLAGPRVRFLEKPFTPAALRQVIAELLGADS